MSSESLEHCQLRSFALDFLIVLYEELKKYFAGENNDDDLMMLYCNASNDYLIVFLFRHMKAGGLQPEGAVLSALRSPLHSLHTSNLKHFYVVSFSFLNS